MTRDTTARKLNEKRAGSGIRRAAGPDLEKGSHPTGTKEESMRQRRNARQTSRSVRPESCVAEVMGTSLFTVTPDTAVSAALRLAADKHVSHFLVVDDGGLTGIVCDTDLQGARRETLVEDCMTSPVLCIGPETTIEEATGIMEENAVGALPVVTGTFLVGMVTRAGLVALDLEWDRDVQRSEAEDDAVLTAAAPLTCVGCGSRRRVVRDVRSNLIPMCVRCLGDKTLETTPKAN